MKRIAFIKLLLMGLLFFSGIHHLQAQAAPTATGPNPYVAVGVGGSIFQSDYGQLHLIGPTVWVDANIHRYVGLEAEGRLLNYNTRNDLKQSTYLIGPRLSYKRGHLAPYVKMPVGIGLMKFPYNYATGKYFVMAPGAGLDYWMKDGAVRIRLIDAEYQVWPQFSFGVNKPYGATVGISFRVF